jgi:hypothetical protein
MPQVLNQRGAALVTALLLTMLSLVMALTLLFVVSTGSRISASQRSYRTALAAAHGGVELFTQEIIPLMFDSGTSAGFLEDRLARVHLQVGEFACLQQKLSVATAGWSQACLDKADADPARFPDATFRLASGRPSEPGFTVSTKIVDSVPGNSDRGGLDYLDLGGGVAARDEAIHPRHVPGIYSIAVQGVREGGESREKAQLSVLYAY